MMPKLRPDIGPFAMGLGEGCLLYGLSNSESSGLKPRKSSLQAD